MSDSDPLRRYLDAGIALTQLTRARAEALVKELVKAGELQREQAQDRVEELLDRSRKSTDSLAGLIRKELAQQLSSMGFATKADLEALEARLDTRIAGPTPSPGPAPAGTTGKAAKAAKAPATAKAAKAPATAKPAKAPATAKPVKAPAAASAPKKATPPPGTAARTATGAKAPRRPSTPATGAGADQA